MSAIRTPLTLRKQTFRTLVSPKRHVLCSRILKYHNTMLAILPANARDATLRAPGLYLKFRERTHLEEPRPPCGHESEALQCEDPRRILPVESMVATPRDQELSGGSVSVRWR